MHRVSSGFKILIIILTILASGIQLKNENNFV